MSGVSTHLQTIFLTLRPEWRRKRKLLLGGSGDLVSRLRMGIRRVTKWVIGVIDLLTKSP